MITTTLVTVKGLFVNSHVRSVEQQLGQDGVQELSRRMGRPLPVGVNEEIDVAEEVRLLSHCLDMLQVRPVPPESRDFETGRLHFQNFTQTPYARIIFTVFRNNPKHIFLRGQSVAEHIIRGMRISSEEVGDHVRLVAVNAGYPLDHLRGLLHEWISYCGYRATIQAVEITPARYEYLISWHNPV